MLELFLQHAPIISMAFFISFFAVVCWFCFRPSMRKKFDEYARIPLIGD